MLSQLSVRNFTLVDSLDLELQPGMSAITGETGAGKSILLDALSLTLGDRADFDKINKKADRAEVTANFDIAHNRHAQKWLQDAALDSEGSCILRRVIHQSGKSQGWINGQACTMGQLREIGELLISIHGQHEHQNLLRRDEQRRLLDDYAGHVQLLSSCQSTWNEWQIEANKLQRLESTQAKQAERVAELEQQLKELDSLAVEQGEYTALEQQQSELAHAETLTQGLFQAQQLLSDSEDINMLQVGSRIQQALADLPVQTSQTEEAGSLIDSALIHLEEAQSILRQSLDRIELDPARLEQIEQRLSAMFQLARKFRIPPEQLASYHEDVRREYVLLENPAEAISTQRERVTQCRTQYLDAALLLSKSRTQAGKKMAGQINDYFKSLSMPGAELKITVTADEKHSSAQGIDHIEFLIRTNPGQNYGALSKIASGGELSRVSLAIQMVTARQEDTPVLIFDEVDAGIGGATANVVGALLSELGERVQVVCVTHLAQVASKARHQLRVEKLMIGESASTQIENLGEQQRLEEIARMLGGQITDKSIDHARQLLGS